METKILKLGTNLIVFLFGFILFFHPLSAFTQDLGRHLKTGEIILTTGKVPKTNLFSYTYPNFPFINHHWFSEVIFYSLTHTFGLFWLLFTMAGMGGLSLLLLYRQTINLSKYSILSLFSIFLFAQILSTRLDLRPEIFSFFCTAIFISILYRFRHNQTKWIFLLPFVEIFWVNVHIYFIIGPFLVGLFLLEKIFLNARKYKFFAHRTRHNTWPKSISIAQQQKFHTDLSALLLLILVFCLCAFATFLNPNTIQGALYPFTVFTNYGYSIEENQSIFTLLNLGFSQPNFIFFFFTVLLLFFVLLVNWKQSKLIDWILASIFTILAFSAVRNFSLFVFVLYIPFVTNLHSVLKHFSSSKKLPTVLGLLFSITLGVWVLMTNIATNGLGFGIPSGAGPAVDFLLKHNLPTPIFNNFDIGSYLEYRLYPKEKVFVDGRPEAYPSSFFQNTYIPMQENPTVFAQAEKKYHFQTIFFSYTDQTPWARTFINSITNNPDWALIYVDTFSAIWIRNTPAHKQYIVHNHITEHTVSIPRTNDSKDLLHYAYFFQLVGWQQAAIKTLQTIVRIDSYNCQVLQMLVQNPSTQMRYSQNYLTHCQ